MHNSPHSATITLNPTSTSWTRETGSTSVIAEAEQRRGHTFHDRYTLGTILATGGSSVVHQAQDRLLERTVAVKVLHPSLAHRQEKRARFLAEARICARLSHPGILTVFDWGVLPDGRPYIVMPEIHGETLRNVLLQAPPHEPLPLDRLRHLIGIVHAASEAMACAHSQGILHRDLKPENIMIGAFGEVYVMDWGLGMIRGEPFPDLPLDGPLDPLDPLDPTNTLYTGGIGWQSHTTDGRVRGTMPYIPPEQAHGRNRSLDERTDVFMLGAVLYEILSGRPPWSWTSNQRALAEARAGQPLLLAPSPHIPPRLREICLQAVDIDPALRFPHAGALAATLKAWLDRQDDVLRAHTLTAHAQTLATEALDCRSQAQILHDQAALQLSSLPETCDEAQKHAAWDQQDEAARLLHRAQNLRDQRIQALHSALSFDPEHHEAHTLLAEQYHDDHRAAEARRDAVAAEQLLLLLARHNRGAYTTYLRPEGSLSLQVDAPDAMVHLSVYREQHRRLQPVPLGDPRPAPVPDLALPIGSYLAEIRAPGRLPIRLPFTIQRAQITHPCTAATGQPLSCPLPTAATAPHGMVFVPPGAFWSGGDPLAYGRPLPLRQVWVDGFWIDARPTTNAQYLAFLNDLVQQGREHEALLLCPRDRARLSCYPRDSNGLFAVGTDQDGHRWLPDWPVVMLPAEAALAYAAWRGRIVGLPLRLPYEMEWEKAARGSDSRVHVWGTEHFEPAWCRNRRAPQRTPAPVATHPTDVSPYGVYDLAGNVADRCQDVYHPEGPIVDDQGRWHPRTDTSGIHVVRGGHWGGEAPQSRLCARGGIPAHSHPSLLGFRLTAPFRGLSGECG